MVTWDPVTGQGDNRSARREDISPFGSVNRQKNEAEIDKAILEICNAILNEGINPEYHREVMRTLMEEWPVLWKAIKHLLEAVGHTL